MITDQANPDHTVVACIFIEVTAHVKRRNHLRMLIAYGTLYTHALLLSAKTSS